jgi:hypothetical protein
MARFTLRLPATLHQELESRAELEGVSLNQYIVYALARQVAAAYTVQVLPEASIKEQQSNYQKLLDSLGRPSLEATRAFLSLREAAGPEAGLSAEMRARVKAIIGGAG